MKKLEWQFFTQNTMSKTNCTITYGLYSVTLYNITDKQRQVLVNLLMSLEKDLPNAPRND